MDVLSFYVTASILAWSSDVGFFQQCGCGWVAETAKEEHKQRRETENCLRMQESLFLVITTIHITNPTTCLRIDPPSYILDDSARDVQCRSRRLLLRYVMLMTLEINNHLGVTDLLCQTHTRAHTHDTITNTTSSFMESVSRMSAVAAETV